MLARVGFASLLAGIVASPVYAMDLTYTGGTGDFLDPSKWMPTGPPGTDDVAIINSGAVTLNSDATVAGLQLNGGMLEGSGVLTVTGSVLWTGGFMGGTGTTNANGGLSVASASTIGLVGTRTLNNAAAGTFTGSISFNNQPSGILNNLPTGTFAITTSADFLGGNFVNQGALTKTAGTGDGVGVGYLPRRRPKPRRLGDDQRANRGRQQRAERLPGFRYSMTPLGTPSS